MSVRCLWEQQGGLCWYCRKRVESCEATVDHVVARSRGGHNGNDNTVMSCRVCNVKKASRRTHRIKTLGRLNALRALAGLDLMSANDAGLSADVAVISG